MKTGALLALHAPLPSQEKGKKAQNILPSLNFLPLPSPHLVCLWYFSLIVDKRSSFASDQTMNSRLQGRFVQQVFRCSVQLDLGATQKQAQSLVLGHQLTWA